MRHLHAELLTDFLIRHNGVFHHVVQKPRNNRLLIHLQIRKNNCHIQRMDDIGFPGLPRLPLVCLRRYLVRLSDQADIR